MLRKTIRAASARSPRHVDNKGELRPQTGPCLGHSADDLRLKALQFLFAQGTVRCLKSNAKQKRILVCTELGIVEDFARAPLNEFGDRESRQRQVNLFPRYALVKHERKIAPHGLEARDVAHSRLTQRQLVKPVEVEFAEKD